MSCVQIGSEASVSYSASTSDDVDDSLHRLTHMIVVDRDENDTITAFITVTTSPFLLLGHFTCRRYYIDVACCYRHSLVSVCVCLLVITMRCARTAMPIQTQCGLWTRLCPRNHVLNSGPDPPVERSVCGDVSWPRIECREYPACG